MKIIFPKKNGSSKTSEGGQKAKKKEKGTKHSEPVITGGVNLISKTRNEVNKEGVKLGAGSIKPQ